MRALVETVYGAETMSIISTRAGYELQQELNKQRQVVSIIIKQNGKVVMELDAEQADAFIDVWTSIAKEKFLLHREHRSMLEALGVEVK